jgi:hypothetical protein
MSGLTGNGRRYVMDQAVVWAEGRYQYLRVDQDAAQNWLRRELWVSRLKDDEARQHLWIALRPEFQQLEDTQPSVGPAILGPGDEALVIRRNESIPQSASPSPGQPPHAGVVWEYGLLTALEPD